MWNTVDKLPERDPKYKPYSVLVILGYKTYPKEFASGYYNYDTEDWRSGGRTTSPDSWMIPPPLDE